MPVKAAVHYDEFVSSYPVCLVLEVCTDYRSGPLYELIAVTVSELVVCGLQTVDVKIGDAKRTSFGVLCGKHMVEFVPVEEPGEGVPETQLGQQFLKAGALSDVKGDPLYDKTFRCAGDGRIRATQCHPASVFVYFVVYAGCVIDLAQPVQRGFHFRDIFFDYVGAVTL